MNESLNKQAELLHFSYLHKLTNEFALPFLSPCACFPQYGKQSVLLADLLMETVNLSWVEQSMPEKQTIL